MDSGEKVEVETVAAWLWGPPGDMPELPEPSRSGARDLIDGPVARRLAAAVSRDPVEQLRVLSDLEDFHEAFDNYGDGR